MSGAKGARVVMPLGLFPELLGAVRTWGWGTLLGLPLRVSIPMRGINGVPLFWENTRFCSTSSARSMPLNHATMPHAQGIPFLALHPKLLYLPPWF